MKRNMCTVLCIGCAGVLCFSILYIVFGAGWMKSVAITFGMFAYHMAVRFLAPVILYAIFRRQYDPNSRWFRQKPWEPKLYAFLKVKQWKKYMMSYDPRQFSADCYTPQEIICNMCHAEAVHELIIPLSLASILLAIPFGALPVFLITAIAAALFDSLFVMMQRYNRPRLIRLMQKTTVPKPTRKSKQEPKASFP